MGWGSPPLVSTQSPCISDHLDAIKADIGFDSLNLSSDLQYSNKTSASPDVLFRSNKSAYWLYWRTFVQFVQWVSAQRPCISYHLDAIRADIVFDFLNLSSDLGCSNKTSTLPDVLFRPIKYPYWHFLKYFFKFVQESLVTLKLHSKN